MDTTIECPYCKKVIPLTQALTHKVQEHYQKTYREALQKKEEEIEKVMKDKVSRELALQYSLKLKDKENETGELKEQNKALQAQLLELNKLLRQLRTENESRHLEYEKKLAEKEVLIKKEAIDKLEGDYRLKMLDKDKRIHDAMKLAEEYKHKLEQGSTQLQGEVLELEIEEILRKGFPTDEISPVPKGIRGADVIQEVRTKSGRKAGIIMWETKRTQKWSNEWIPKLKDDLRTVSGEIAVLVTSVLPEGISHFGYVGGVWVTSFAYITSLATALRHSLIEISAIKVSQVGKSEKLEVLHEYITGVDFRHKVEAIVEAFSSLQDEMEREKRWFASKWARQEKSIRRVIDQTLGMHGDLQSIMGKTLPELKGVDMLPEGKKDQEELF